METNHHRDIFLYPYPRKLERREGALRLAFPPRVTGGRPDDPDWKSIDAALEKCFAAAPPAGRGEGGGTAVAFLPDDSLPREGYTLRIGPEGIRIGYRRPAGAFYALQTLCQLAQPQPGRVPCLAIEDSPDFPARGVMTDIGRGKIPTPETVRELIDRLSGFKINQLQLYMEGYCFAYPDFAGDFPGATPLTAEEIRSLDAYARAHFMQLVPAPSNFGHMAPWLALGRFRQLAENEAGLPLLPGITLPPSTLNPLDPRSLELARTLLDELLPHFSAPYVNICEDEPFDLGSGKSAGVCRARGRSRVYLDFVRQVGAAARKNGKTPMVWGDTLTGDPGLLDELPRDMIVLDWNYDSAVSFETHARMLEKSGAPFYVCPGTSSWGSVAGRTENMKANIRDAAAWGRTCGAAGLLVTDWGDAGHWQCPPVSYPGFVYAAALAWNTDGNREMDIADCLDRFVFCDAARKMGRLALELGETPRWEGVDFPNNTLLFLLLAEFGLCGHAQLERKLSAFRAVIGKLSSAPRPVRVTAPYDFDGMAGLLGQARADLTAARPAGPDAGLLCREWELTIRLLRHGAHLAEWDLRGEALAPAARRRLLDTLREEIDAVIALYPPLFLARFRKGGLSGSMSRFYRLREQYRAADAARSEPG